MKENINKETSKARQLNINPFLMMSPEESAAQESETTEGIHHIPLQS